MRSKAPAQAVAFSSMPWMANADAAPKPVRTTSTPIENLRNQPGQAMAESTIATTTRRVKTAVKAWCVVSLNPASIQRELIAKTVWVGVPDTPIATSDSPAQRRLLRAADRQTPTPKATSSRS